MSAHWIPWRPSTITTLSAGSLCQVYGRTTKLGHNCKQGATEQMVVGTQQLQVGMSLQLRLFDVVDAEVGLLEFEPCVVAGAPSLPHSYS